MRHSVERRLRDQSFVPLGLRGQVRQPIATYPTDRVALTSFPFSPPLRLLIAEKHQLAKVGAAHSMADLFSQIPPHPDQALRVLHSADWHLGKPLGDLSRAPEHEAFFTFLLNAIIEHRVDVLLVAGDVFDSAHPPQSAIKQYYDFLSQLREQTDCEVVVIAGNHDSPALLDAPRELLSAQRVTVVGAYPSDAKQAFVTLGPEAGPRVHVAAIPFLRDRDLRTGKMGESQSSIQEQLVAGIGRCYKKVVNAIKRHDETWPIIAMGHLTVRQCETCPDSEREIHVGGLGTVDASIFPKSIDYLALGHLHRPQQIGDRAHMRYSGSPIPLSFAEAGDEKEVRILDFSATGLEGNYGLRVPSARRLIQWHLRRDELELYLTQKRPPKSALTPWVEVLVTDPISGENLYEIVRDYAADRPYEVVKVIGRYAQKNVEGTMLGQLQDDSAADTLLREPKRVFENRLLQEESLTEDEQSALRLAFDELLTLKGERDREF